MKVNVIITITVKYTHGGLWICFGSETCQNSEFGRVLNMWALTAFWIGHNMPWQSSEYISGSNYARILNMTGFWKCKKYTGF